jgi:hypothetical protein
MNRLQIGGKLEWAVADKNVFRVTSPRPHPVHPFVYCPNAYSGVIGVILADHKGYALTRDKAIVEMSNQYRFISVTHLDHGVYRVEVHRTADDLPEIYRWMHEHVVNFHRVTQVPWVHPAHTEATWGYCPYCEEKLTHENWAQHRYAECLGQGSLDHEFTALPADFGKRLVSRNSMEPLNVARGILRLFRWKKLMKTAAGSFVCWEKSFSENTAIQTMPNLFVYGSEWNQIEVRKGDKKRDQIQVVEPIAIGTTIMVSPQRQVDSELHCWGKI